MKTAILRKLTARTVLVLAMLALIVTAIAGAVVPDVSAAGQYIETTYYSNASMTVPVGVRIQTCSGTLLRFGKVSIYHDTFSEPCF